MTQVEETGTSDDDVARCIPATEGETLDPSVLLISATTLCSERSVTTLITMNPTSPFLPKTPELVIIPSTGQDYSFLQEFWSIIGPAELECGAVMTLSQTQEAPGDPLNPYKPLPALDV